MFNEKELEIMKAMVEEEIFVVRDNNSDGEALVIDKYLVSLSEIKEKLDETGVYCYS